MTLDLSRLDEVPVGNLDAHLYLRHCWLPPSGNPNPVSVNPRGLTRWHTCAGTLYLAEDDVTVWCEHCRHSAREIEAADPTGGVGLHPANFSLYAGQALREPVLARALYGVRVRFDRVADLTTETARAALRACGVNPDTDLFADGFGPCPDIAKAGEALGWRAVRARSAARPAGMCVAVFNGWFPPRPAFARVGTTERPNVAAAYVTRYLAGERPGWLGAAPV